MFYLIQMSSGLKATTILVEFLYGRFKNSGVAELNVKQR